MNIDHAKVRREGLRWLIMLALNHARPSPLHESVVLSAAQGIYGDATAHELRREIEYLDERDLVKIDKKPNGIWFADLTRYGIDVVEYTSHCEPGIARPEKYW